MEREVLLAIRNLLESNRVLALAVMVDGTPEAALLPYAVSPGFDAVIVQASALARHARGLVDRAPVGLLVHAPDNPDADPMQLARLAVQATVGVIERDTAAFAEAAGRLTARFPAAAMTLDLADFTLYRLAFGRGRYVEGFARAFNVGAETFREVAALTMQE